MLAQTNHMPSSRRIGEDNKEVVKAAGEAKVRAGVDLQMGGSSHTSAITVVWRAT